MTLNISQLKNKWSKEKVSYSNKEIGDGVQKFVKDVLRSEEIFNLKEGLNSTPLLKRKNEFKEEESKKGGRHADIVIFINPQIVIPVEVEKYKNIEVGKDQILQYQLDWDKKYGILTDGHAWRFYNNNIFREFNLIHILEDTDTFLEFWREYIKPESYYLSFFEKQGQLSLLKEVEELPVDSSRQIFFEDITNLISSFNKKLKIEGYFEKLEKAERDKKATEITYAYIIQFILYKTLVDNEFGNFDKGFGERVNAIYGCLKSKQYGDILGIIGGISKVISENIYRPFAKEQQFIVNTLLNMIHKPKKELHDVSPWLDIFVFIKKYNFANVKNDIFGYIYENYLKERYEETQKGQYFTDPAVVNFMLDQVGYTSTNIQERLKNRAENDYISIIDPSCGSGTFLYSGVDRLINTIKNSSQESSKKIEDLINNNIFGLDIAEFPLYLAEMNILMRMLTLIISEKYNNPVDKKIKVFKTIDSIAEFMDTSAALARGKGESSLFTEKLNLGYSSYVRDEDDLKEMKRSLENQVKIPRRRFDFVIGNPPYVTYNECSKQGLLIVKLIQEKECKMSDIYRVNLNTVPGRIKAYAPKPNLYAFFIALGLALLKKKGKLCFIIPQTILTAGDLDVLRYHLAKFTTIEKLITFSGKMFIGRGLKQDKPVPTSSLIFVVNPETPNPLHEVEITHYTDPNDDIEECLKNISNEIKVNRKNILQKELLQNVANWNFIKHDSSILKFFKHYNQNEKFDIYRVPELFKTKFGDIFYFDKGLVFPKNKISPRSKLSNNSDYFNLIRADKYRYKLNLSGEVIFKKDIRFPKGSQGIKVYEKRYKIVWRYMNTNRFYFTDEKIMINFNWVLISSDNKNEMLYILSLLNSNLNGFVFESLLKSENEKDLLIGIKSVKEFIHVPNITKDNQFIKEEIIKKTEEMLALEDVKLSDLVDFSGLMVQKYDNIKVEGNKLILSKNDDIFKCKIKDGIQLVSQTIQDQYGDYELKLTVPKISLLELKSMPIIDYEKQKELKDYIDDLVFALYFNVQISGIGINKSKLIKSTCKEIETYKIINKHS